MVLELARLSRCARGVHPEETAHRRELDVVARLLDSQNLGTTAPVRPAVPSSAPLPYPILVSGFLEALRGQPFQRRFLNG